ncbi:MAG: ABC transporter permease [Treponema sp.]|jgi:peptide/nickel transport system permease protein|nr:ABC transporter permease [Treponema sp.]
MLHYLIRRFFLLCFLMAGISLVVFLLSHAVPSDPVVANLSERNLDDAEMVAAFRAKWGLDQPLYKQYLRYLKNLLHGDLGISIRTQRPVLEDLIRYFPATVELALFGMFFAVFFGMIFGVISAVKRGSLTEQVLRGMSIFGVSVPSYWLALILLYVFYLTLGIAPGPGRISTRITAPDHITGFFLLDSLLQGKGRLFADSLRHLILPGMCLGMFTTGLISRTTRSSLLETFGQDYIRTAQAKGLSRQRILVKHALGNALLPVVTIIGMGFSNLLSGMVLVETIFAWPGIGQYAFQSAQNLDFPAIVGVSLLIALNHVVINLAIDLLYGVLDPRVRYR